MHKEIVSSCENENLKIFEGRVLTLLGDISAKLDQILFQIDSDLQNEYDEARMGGQDNFRDDG